MLQPLHCQFEQVQLEHHASHSRETAGRQTGGPQPWQRGSEHDHDTHQKLQGAAAVVGSSGGGERGVGGGGGPTGGNGVDGGGDLGGRDGGSEGGGATMTLPIVAEVLAVTGTIVLRERA